MAQAVAQGALVSGQTAEGAIAAAGDEDTWTFTAAVGDNLLLRAGELNETSGTGGFTPALRLYGPGDVLLAQDASNRNAVEVSAVATTPGSFTVVVSDGGSYLNGTGSYRLHWVKSPGAIEIAAGDEGGALSRATANPGAISTGDLDLWLFEANARQSNHLEPARALGHWGNRRVHSLDQALRTDGSVAGH